MPEPTTHPSRAELSAYNLGQLPPEEAAAIENHISECEPCCETIVGMSSDDTFVALLQEARQLPTDQTLDHDSSTVQPSSSLPHVPAPLAEHPRYEVIELIGKGGMGDVYKARHRMMKRTVALKIIKSELVRRPEAVDRFHREVTTAARLAHPNIVTSHDAEQAGDVHFLVMEYVDGVDLAQIVKDRGALPVTEACDYIRQAAVGLQHAHERGMVHRDIKPHNLMVTADGTVKILDFGLASLSPEPLVDSEAVDMRGDLTAAGAIMGTPDFISPEQAEDAHQADIRSDIYSLGATLYFLLSGRPPFADGSVMHKLKSHAQAEPEPLASLRDDVPPELVAVVTKMTAKDPEERYLTPSEVADALESFLRTWRTGEAEARGQEPSNGGNMSGSGGQKPVAGDLSSDWLSAWAKWLFYISFVPIAVFILDVFFLSDETSVAAADRGLYYLLASVGLSSVAAVLSGVNQFKTSNREDHRIYRFTTETSLLIAAILIGAVVYFFIGTNIGGIRVEVTPPEDIGILGTHPLTIVDTSGKKPLGGTSKTHQDDASGITTHSFKSANARYSITLVDKVLTVNGERYTLENPTDAIRIVDDRVEITQVTALPDVVRELRDVDESDGTADDPSPADGYKPATASTSTSKPELKITGKTVNKGTAGLPSVYDWNFKGRDVGDLKVRLLLAQNGKTEVMQDFDFEELPTEFANKVRLEVRDNATGADRKRRVNAVLFVESPVPSRSATVNEDKGLSIDVEAPFSNRIERADLAPIAPGKTELLMALSYWRGDMTHDRSMESMTAATTDGNVTFLFVTLDWSPASPDLTQLQGDWDVIAFTQNGKKEFAADKGVGMLVQIKGDTITRIQKAPNDEKSEKEWGRIELNSKTNPKSIDIVNPDGPGGRLLGIYELKDGALRICFAERSNVDDAQGSPVKRPKTFDAPAGSRNVLLECRRVDEDPDLKQLRGDSVNEVDLGLLQCDWETVSLTEGGKQLSAENGFGGLLLQIRGNTFVIAERKPNGEKSEVDTGRIEINSTTTPKTIDFIGRAQSTFGIYEFKDVVLRVCLIEQGGTDAPAEERVPGSKTLKRPTTFESPAGSNVMLLEFRPMAENELETVSQLMRQANQPDTGSQLAINELLRRENGDLLDSDQVNDLLEVILKYQADRERPWRTEMGDLIEKCWLDGTLDRDIWEKYTAQFLVDICELKVRPRIVIGSPSGVLVQRNIRDVRCGSGKYIEFLLREKNGVTRVGSTIVGRVDVAGTTQIGHDNSGMSSANSSALTEQLWDTIEPGRQKITFDVDLAILESVGPEASEGLDVFASRKATFETEATFLPAGQSTVNVNVDPAMKNEVDRAITIKRVETGPMSRPTTSEKYFARVVLAVQPRPIDNIFTIVLRDGETEYDAGSHAHVIKAEEGNDLISMASIAADLSGKRIDVILRPAPDEAERSIDLFDIWGEEIVFEDVLVQ